MGEKGLLALCGAVFTVSCIINMVLKSKDSPHIFSCEVLQPLLKYSLTLRRANSTGTGRHCLLQEFKRILRPRTGDKSCLTPQVRVMALRVR